MIKKLFFIIIITFIFSGCSNIGTDEASTREGNVQGEDTTTIIWWGLFETQENLQPLIDAFEAENPEIKIEYTQKDESTYMDQLNQVLSDDEPNTTPDIFMIHNTWVGNYESYTTIAPTSVISADDFKNTFHTFVASDFAFDDQVRGIPLWVDMLGLVYNNDYLVSTGETSIASDWNNFQNQAKNMTIIDEDSGEMTQGGFSAGTSSNVEFYFDVMNLLWLQSRQMPLEGDDRFVPYLESEIDSAEGAVSFYESFLNANKTWDSSIKLDTAAFIEGNLASLIVPSWRIYDIIAYDEEKNLNLDFAVSQVPQLNADETNKVNIPTYWGYVVSDDSSNNDISWRFIKFLSDKDQQELYIQTVEANGRPFALTSPRQDLVGTQTGNEYLEPYISSIPYINNWYMTNGSKLEQPYADVLSGTVNLEELLVIVNNIRENSTEL